MEHQSFVRVESRVCAGVSFVVARMSFGRRLQLMERVRELACKLEYLDAGKEPVEELDAAALSAAIDREYLNWGLREISGLSIDGDPATPHSLADAGPEELCREAIDAVKAQCGLNEEEKKTS